MDRLKEQLANETTPEEGLERVKAELLALDAERLPPITLNVRQTVETVLGVLPEVKALREELLRVVPTFDWGQVERLEDYALALTFAQAMYKIATHPEDGLKETFAAALKARELLLLEARLLICRGVLHQAQLERLHGAKGYNNVAADLALLSALLERVLDQIQGKTWTTRDDLDHYSRLSTRLLRVVGLRDQSPAATAEANDLRLRAHAKLLTAYNNTRHAIIYLRRKKAAVNAIIPPLHPGRPKSRKKAAELPPRDVVQPPDGTPAAALE